VRRRPLPRAGFAAFQIELIAERAAADAHLPGQDVDPMVAILGGITGADGRISSNGLALPVAARRRP
jgi:hypothetical protein